MTILVSACLLGTACRYDGRSKADAAVTALLARHTLIPVCLRWRKLTVHTLNIRQCTPDHF